MQVCSIETGGAVVNQLASFAVAAALETSLIDGNVSIVTLWEASSAVE